MLHMLLLPAKNNQKPTKNQRRNFFTPFNLGPWLVLNPMKTKENQRRIFFTPFNLGLSWCYCCKIPHIMAMCMSR